MGKTTKPRQSTAAKSSKKTMKAKPDFLRKNDEIDDDALNQGEAKVGGGSNEEAKKDNRARWADNIITNKPIKVLSKEFASNKKYKPSNYTTEAYDRNDAKNRHVTDRILIDIIR
ncbi:hypothetical protein Q1695_012543 [Nippostrongylus brasiliensis]|nr:hypothetical protein Q1695_012543 [Nippostrongylus brasiliensis]